MNKIIVIILILLVMACQKITVLEVAINQDDSQNMYRIIYEVSFLGESQVKYGEYLTTMGVRNFIDEVSDEDLSGWNIK